VLRLQQLVQRQRMVRSVQVLADVSAKGSLIGLCGVSCPLWIGSWALARISRKSMGLLAKDCDGLGLE
jgi:hypothetical protein